MQQINFEQAQLLIGRKGVTIVNENHLTIDSWVLFFNSQRFYTDSQNLLVLTPKNA